MLTSSPIVFLLDVDNTLIDNDRFGSDLTARLYQEFGQPECERYWSIYGALRDKHGFADYLGALQDFRTGCNNEAALLQMSKFLLDYPFNERVYPRARDAIRHMNGMGNTVILSDGDIVFQPRKIQRSGLWDAVEGRVLVYLHKERMLAVMQRHFPATHYVMLDDKPKLLAAMKRVLADRMTTVFVRQGHYAADSEPVAIDPAPDLVVEHIGDLCDVAPAFFDLTTSPGTKTQTANQGSKRASPEFP